MSVPGRLPTLGLLKYAFDERLLCAQEQTISQIEYS
jgi:hypothetical protein